MSDLILNTLTLILILILASTTIWTTSQPSPRTRSNSRYRYFTPPLPADETTAAGKDSTWCTRGHVPDSQILQLRL